VDHSPELQRRFGVQSIPTLLVLRKGHEIARQIGAAPAPQLREWVAGALSG
jgi:thioredoxin 2